MPQHEPRMPGDEPAPDIAGLNGEAKEAKLPTIEEIRAQREKLEQKVAAARAGKERDIRDKAVGNERLFNEGIRSEALLEEARETLEYYRRMQLAGKLQDAEDVARLRDIEGTVKALEERQKTLRRGADAIAAEPEVMARIREEADAENQERSLKKLSEDAHRELDPEADRLAEDIKSLAERDRHVYSERRGAEELHSTIRYEFRNAVGKLTAPLTESGKSNLPALIDGDFGASATGADFRRKLEARQEELRFYQFKGRNIIGRILKETKRFADLDESSSKVASAEKAVEAHKSEVDRLAGRYRDIIFKAWEAEDEAARIAGARRSLGLPSEFSRKISDRIYEFMDMERMKDGRKAGHYDSVYKALQNPDNKWLYGVWEDVIEKAGGGKILHSNPNKAAGAVR